jgi:hypothetical protein
VLQNVNPKKKHVSSPGRLPGPVKDLYKYVRCYNNFTIKVNPLKPTHKPLGPPQATCRSKDAYANHLKPLSFNGVACAFFKPHAA